MKNLLPILSIITFLSFSTQSFACLPGGLIIETQADIDNFATNYPGCVVIEGNLYIEDNGTDPITNFDGLAQITKIYGDLDIEECPSISKLVGFDNLTVIGGEFYIYNTGLTSLDGLENLEEINGSFSLDANEYLENIDALEKLAFVDGHLYIAGNSVLTNIFGLKHLLEIDGYINVSSNNLLQSLEGLQNILASSIKSTTGAHTDLEIFDNENLSVCNIQNICNIIAIPTTTTNISNNKTECNSKEEIEAACSSCFLGGITFKTQAEIDDFIVSHPNCQTIGGDVEINESVAGNITNLDGLSNVRIIKGRLVLNHISNLTDISGLQNLISIHDDLSIFYVGGITNLVGLENLSNLGGDFTVVSCSDLVNFQGIKLTSIGGDVNFNGNNELTSLIGLDNLTHIGGNLSIIQHDKLASISQLSNLRTIGGYLHVNSNKKLTSLSGLENIQDVSGNLEVEGNLILQDISGLSGIKTIDGDLSIRSNPELSNLLGLTQLNQLTGKLRIVSNATLERLEELNKLTTIKSLSLINNPNLESLNGLKNITTCSGSVTIINNDALVNLKGLNKLTSIHGTITITDNEMLVSLEGLENIDVNGIVTFGGPALEIKNNPNLSNCDVQFLCDALEIPEHNYDISSNNEGCNSESEVSAACTTCRTSDILLETQEQIDNFAKIDVGCTVVENMIIEESTPGDITNLNGLSNITSVVDLEISRNNALLNFSGLDNLTTIGYLRIFQNDGLVNFSGLDNLTTVNTRMRIEFNPDLQEIGPLNNLTSSPSFKINGNNNLTSLSGFSNIVTVEDFQIINNDNLLNLSGLNNIVTAEDIEISENNKLLNLSGLNELTTVDGDLEILENNKLSSLSGLEKLTSVQGNFDLYDNPDLINITSLNNLTNVGFFICESNGITDLSGLENLESCGIRMYSNPNLTSVSALQNLKTVSEISFIDNPNLPSLDGLQNITTNTGGIYILNSTFTHLNELSQLTQIGGSIYLRDNTALNDISGLQNIDEVSIKYTGTMGYDDLNISRNPNLSQCAINSFCGVLNNIDGRKIVIENNKDGCNSIDEVEMHCQENLCTSFISPTNGQTNVNSDSNLSWEASTNANGYKLRIGTTPGGSDILALTDLGNTTSFNPDENLPCGVLIYAMVIPYNDGGDALGCSEIGFRTESMTQADAGEDDSLCAGRMPATITATGGDTYQWSPTTGLSSPNTASTSAYPSETTVYTVTVSRNGRCPSTDMVTVFSYLNPEISLTVTNETANNANDGTITAEVTVGEAPYTYDWSNGATSQTISNLAPDSYSVTVNDANGCFNSKMATVTAFGCPDFTINEEIVNVTCHGACDAQINITEVINGTAPFTYEWSNNATTAEVTGLCAGDYQVTVTDSKNCSFAKGYTITEPNEMIVHISGTNETGNGFNDGTASSTTTGGTTPYIYAWSNGATTQNITSLSPDTYTLTITDAKGCTAIANINILAFDCPTITINATVTNETANNTNDGTATCNPTGGTSPYTYLWSNGSTTQSISSLNPGSYSLTVTDSKGCTGSQTITVVEYGCSEFTIEETIENVSCFEACDGSINIINVTNGVAPYTYNWSNGDATNKIESLCPSMYVVTITDANGCKYSKSYNITQPNDIIITLDTKTDVTDSHKGSISINTNDDGNYTYSWSHAMGFTSTSEDITGLEDGGCYTVVVTNANGCSKEAEFCIDNLTANSDLKDATNHINLYPNPASNMLYIEFNGLDIKNPQISLIDIAGKEQILENIQKQEQSMQIDIKNIESGFYLIKINSENRDAIYKKVLILK